MLSKSQRGFTLIEVMIVVGIIGILASIAIPAFTAYKEKVQTTEAINNISALHRGMAAYFQQEHTADGVSGTTETRCLPQGTFGWEPAWPPTNGDPSTKRFGDFSDPAWAAVHFQPSEPLYFSIIWANGTGGGNGCASATSSINPAVQVFASGDPDGNRKGIFIEAPLAIDEGKLIRPPALKITHDIQY